MKMTKITYTRTGDYELPDLTPPKEPQTALGQYARMRRKYLKEHRRILYYELLTSCKLKEHLTEIEQRATAMEDSLVRRMAKDEGVTESMKATDMMTWVRMMNNIRSRARETVLSEVVFA